MNPAALKANLGDLPARRRRSSSTPTSSPAQPRQGRLRANPLEDGSLDGYRVHPVAADLDDGRGAQGRSASPRRTPSGRRTCSRSACCPGCTTGPTEGDDCVPAAASSPRSRRSSRPTSPRSRPAGTTARPPRTSRSRYEVKPGAAMPPGTYRNISGNLALAYGLVAAGAAPACRCSSASYPITPASRHPARAEQAQAVRRHDVPGRGRDRRRSARPSARRSAGALGVTTTSGPGIALKSEAIGLAVMPGAAAGRRRHAARRARRPACRPRPSRPTCCRRCSAATARRRCRSSRRSRRRTASTPRSRRCGSRSTYRTPVFLLSDGYLANGSEPWRHPGRRRPARPARSRSRPSPTAPTRTAPSSGRTCATRETLARPWAVPGTPGLEHRIGGIEKADGTGNISYDPDNHDAWSAPAQAKVDGIAASSRPGGRRPRRRRPRVLVVGWGSTYGPIGAAVPAAAQRRARRSRRRTCATSTRSRRNLGEVLQRYERVLVPEMNLGQLALLHARASTWSTRSRLQPGPRAAVQGRPSSPRYRGRDRSD